MLDHCNVVSGGLHRCAVHSDSAPPHHVGASGPTASPLSAQPVNLSQEEKIRRFFNSVVEQDADNEEESAPQHPPTNRSRKKYFKSNEKDENNNCTGNDQNFEAVNFIESRDFPKKPHRSLRRTHRETPDGYSEKTTALLNEKQSYKNEDYFEAQKSKRNYSMRSDFKTTPRQTERQMQRIDDDDEDKSLRTDTTKFNRIFHFNASKPIELPQNNSHFNTTNKSASRLNSSKELELPAETEAAVIAVKSLLNSSAFDTSQVNSRFKFSPKKPNETENSLEKQLKGTLHEASQIIPDSSIAFLDKITKSGSTIMNDVKVDESQTMIWRNEEGKISSTEELAKFDSIEPEKDQAFDIDSECHIISTSVDSFAETSVEEESLDSDSIWEPEGAEGSDYDSDRVFSDPSYCPSTSDFKEELCYPAYVRNVPRTGAELTESLKCPVNSPANSHLARVAILGLPNSGKSTLVNALLEDRVMHSNYS